ncbi:MAG: hypothetical protein ACM3VX_00095 [Bacteroidota bacterium]
MNRRMQLKRWVAGLTLLLAMAGMAGRAEGAAQFVSYTLDWRNRPVAAPLGYVVEDVLTGIGQLDVPMRAPQDLFLDREENLWIADTDGNRIIKMTRTGEVLLTITEADGMPLSGPQGIFIDDQTGELFIADTGNKRIVRLNADLSVNMVYGPPKSLKLGPDFNFQPTKIVVDKSGNMYIVNGGDFHGFLQMDIKGRFRQWFGANKVPFSITRVLTRVFASEQQREQLTRVLPPPPSNAFLHPSGYMYVTSAFATSSQIKKLNAVGSNSFPSQFYGEIRVEGWSLVRPQFIDVSVDQNDIVSALDANTGRVYQYDQDGNTLLVFGGQGDQRGVFKYPSSLVVDSRGWLYVLDNQRNDIQVFRPTEFAQLVHKASELYYAGKYPEAADLWRRVLDMNTNYELAHKGIARNYYKDEEYRKAMVEYRLAHDKSGYSMAFAELRKEWSRAHFPLLIGLVLLTIAVLVGIGVAISLYVRAGWRRPGQAVEEA